MPTYVVGDIQGCHDQLIRLLETVKFNPKKDKLWAAGDLIARGPKSLETLEFLYSLGSAFDTVLGNHDLHLLAIANGLRKAKPSDKLAPLLQSKHLNKYCDWLRSKPLATELNQEYLLTHAGLYPNWSSKKALKYSEEVQQILSSDNWLELIANMYGDSPNIWDKSLSGIRRWRFIINAFTRMRFVTNDLALDFACKTSPSDAPSNLKPWFEISNKKNKHKLVFGHWAALVGNTGNERIYALDTGCVWGNTLTILALESGKIYSTQ